MASTSPTPPRTVEVKGQKYTVRSIQPSEIKKWSEFCASCFATKKPIPPPPSYFANHYFHDPHRDPHLILVLQTASEQDTDEAVIVSTLRIFKRIISPGGLCVGGIGEVCTSPDYRRRGLISVLLDEADCVLKREGFDCSLLHAAEAFHPVYQKFGYANVRSNWSVVTVNMEKLMTTGCVDPKTTVREACDMDWQILKDIHSATSESFFAGCIIRSLDYWRDYIGKEIGVHVLENDCGICGWMSLRARPNGRYQLREYGANSELVSHRDCILGLLQVLLAGAKDNLELHLPTIILEKVKSEVGSYIFDWECVHEEDDNGWMYKNLCGKEESDMETITKKIPHLIWPSDSF